MIPITVEVNAVHEPTGRAVVRGWNIGIPGLVVTEAFTNGSGERCWAVTHERSGYCLSSAFSSPEAAVACAHNLADVTDWTLPAVTLRAGPDVKRAVVEAHRSHGADIPSAGVVPGAQLAAERYGQ